MYKYKQLKVSAETQKDWVRNRSQEQKLDFLTFLHRDVTPEEEFPVASWKRDTKTAETKLFFRTWKIATFFIKNGDKCWLKRLKPPVPYLNGVPLMSV